MATNQIPIVFIGSGDPVGLGLVQSLARPGGNITGVADLDIELVPKRMEIFRELVPGLKRVLTPYDATNADARGATGCAPGGGPAARSHARGEAAQERRGGARRDHRTAEG